MYLSPEELEGRTWNEERDFRRQQLFDVLRPYRKWGIVVPMPVNHKSPHLRCDLCSYPREQAEYVMFQPDRLYCKRHMNEYKRLPDWKRKVRQQQENYQRKVKALNRQS